MQATVLLILAALLPPPTDADGGTIVGRVTCGVGGGCSADVVLAPDHVVKADHDGTFRITGVSPGVQSLTTELLRFYQQMPSSVCVRSGEESFVELNNYHNVPGDCITMKGHSLPDHLDVRARVVDPDGSAVRSAEVSIENVRHSEVVWTGTTSWTGRFRVKSLRVDGYRLTINAPGFFTRVLRFDLDRCRESDSLPDTIQLSYDCR